MILHVTGLTLPTRLLGVDYGARRIGIAASEGAIAVPLSIVEHIDRRRDLERVAALAHERDARAIVVGLPLLMSGAEGEQAKRTRRFGDALARASGLPVIYHDERLSSFRAAGAVADTSRRTRPADDAAAAIILQSWLDSQPAPAAAPVARPEGEVRT